MDIRDEEERERARVRVWEETAWKYVRWGALAAGCVLCLVLVYGAAAWTSDEILSKQRREDLRKVEKEEEQRLRELRKDRPRR